MNMDTTPQTGDGTSEAAWLASLLAKQNPQWLARYVAFRRRIQQMTRSRMVAKIVVPNAASFACAAPDLSP